MGENINEQTDVHGEHSVSVTENNKEKLIKRFHIKTLSNCTKNVELIEQPFR
jgi:hypothetical protein